MRLKRVKVKELAETFERPLLTIYTILKNKDALLSAFESGELRRERLSDSKWPQLENALLAWFKDVRLIRPPLLSLTTCSGGRLSAVRERF